MPLTDRKVLTFDVVGTLIDFETGILDYVQGKSKSASPQAILEAYAIAEDRQHQETPRLPFPSMMAPMYREMAAKLGLPAAEEDVQGFRLSIPRWPRLPRCRRRPEAPAQALPPRGHDQFR
jgi:putative hydrolase of the HAD superfamily